MNRHSGFTDRPFKIYSFLQNTSISPSSRNIPATVMATRGNTSEQCVRTPVPRVRCRQCWTSPSWKQTAGKQEISLA